jgi:hypothetical protein
MVQPNFLPSKPYNPEADPSLKGALEVIRIANEAIDEAVDRLLNEAVTPQNLILGIRKTLRRDLS